jgi:hypothetical protein
MTEGANSDGAMNVTPQPPAFAAGQPAWLRLEDQQRWFSRKSGEAQQRHKLLRTCQVALGVAIPVFVLLPTDVGRWASALAGGLIALLEAVQHLQQYATLWVNYRNTAALLKREKFLFLSAAGPYVGLVGPDCLRLLSERTEELLTAELGTWVAEARRAASTDKPAPGADKKPGSPPVPQS